MKIIKKYMVGKVNMFDFASKENAREAMTGVYHENGFKIATDGKILFAVKSDYTEELEGKCLMRDGAVKELRYPNWKSIFPFDKNDYKENEWLSIKLVREDFYEWVKNNREIKREVYGKSKTWYDEWLVYGGNGNFFNARLYDLFTKATNEIYADEMMVKKESISTPAFCKNELGVVLMMPMFITEETAIQKMEDEEIDVFPITCE